MLANLLRPNCPDVLDRRWVLVGHYTHHHPNDIQTTSKRNFCIYFFTPRLSPSSFIRFVPSFDCMDHSAEVFDLDSCGPCNKHVGTFVSLPGPPPFPIPRPPLALQLLYLASRAADTRKNESSNADLPKKKLTAVSSSHSRLLNAFLSSVSFTLVVPTLFFFLEKN